MLQIRVLDNVAAQHQLVTKHFGITKLVAVVGWSMGAGQTYQWAVRYGACPSHQQVVLSGDPACGCGGTA